MARLVTILITETSAQDLGEYGIALAVITAGVILAAAVIGGDLGALWNGRANVLASL
jgi:Flp pilus assembly pilin Flp